MIFKFIMAASSIQMEDGFCKTNKQNKKTFYIFLFRQSFDQLHTQYCITFTELGAAVVESITCRKHFIGSNKMNLSSKMMMLKITIGSVVLCSKMWNQGLMSLEII